MFYAHATFHLFPSDPTADCERFYDALKPRICNPITVEIEVRENGDTDAGNASTNASPFEESEERTVHIHRSANGHVTQKDTQNDAHSNGLDSDWPLPLLVTHFTDEEEKRPITRENERVTKSWSVGMSCRATRTSMRNSDCVTMHGVSELYTYKDSFSLEERVFEVER